MRRGQAAPAELAVAGGSQCESEQEGSAGRQWQPPQQARSHAAAAAVAALPKIMICISHLDFDSKCDTRLRLNSPAVTGFLVLSPSSSPPLSLSFSLSLSRSLQLQDEWPQVAGRIKNGETLAPTVAEQSF